MKQITILPVRTDAGITTRSFSKKGQRNILGQHEDSLIPLISESASPE